MAIRTQLSALLALGLAVFPVAAANGQLQVNPPRYSSAPPQPRFVPPAEDDAPRSDRAVEEGNVFDSAPTAMAHDFLRARDLIGMTVRGDADAELGTVYDVYIDPRTFGVQYIVLETAADATTAAQFPVLPWALFRASATSVHNGYLTVPLSVARLAAAPVVDINKTDLAATAAWLAEAAEFYEADLRTIRASRPDFDDRLDAPLNDAGNVPIERRTQEAGVVPSSNAAAAPPHRQGLRPQQWRPQTGRSNPQSPRVDPGATQPGAPRVPQQDINDPPGNAPASSNPPGGRNPPGNAGRFDNPPGGRNPPGNAAPADNTPGGQTPPGNAGASSPAPANGAVPSGSNVPSGGNPAGAAPPPAGAPQ